MAVTDDPDAAATRVQGIDAVNVTIGSQGRWAPAWRTAMEVSWSIA
jgi:hypothetical protein